MINMFQEAPNTYREDLHSEERDKWLTTANEEFQGLRDGHMKTGGLP